MYNECVARLSDTLILAKKENQLGAIVDEYTSIIYDMLNSGNKLNMQIGSMLNPMRPLINCIEEPSDFFICSDSISKNIPEFSTTELNSRSTDSKEVIDFYAKSNMITELNESKKLQVIFSQSEAQKQLIDSYLNSFKETIINRGLDGGSFLTGFNETIDVLYKLNPKIFMECYSNTIGASIDGTPIRQSLAKQYEGSLKSLNAEQLIQEVDKIDSGNFLFEKNKIICEEFFKRSKKELNKENISSLLYTMVSSGTNSDFIRQFCDKVKNYGFNVTDIVKLTIKNISERNDLEPFVKEALIDNLCNGYNGYETLKKENTSFIRRIRLQNNRKSIEELKNKMTKEIKSKPARVKDEHGKTLIVSLYDQKSVDLYFQQEEKSCEALEIIDTKSLEHEIAKLEKNKMIMQNLGIHRPQLVTKDDTEIKPLINQDSHVAKITQKAMDKTDLTKSYSGF